MLPLFNKGQNSAEENSDLKGNMRDYAKFNALVLTICKFTMQL